MDEATFNALYGATAKPLWTYVARMSGRHDVADDVLQETFLRFLGSARVGLEISEARPYLFRIATNLLHDRWRRVGNEVALKTEEPVSPPDPGTALDAARMLGQLKPRARELLWLAYVEGLTHREIAQVTGLGRMSVRILLHRARGQAAALLKSKGSSHVR